MTIPRKPCKNKVVPPTIPIIKEKEKLHAEIYHLDEDIIDTNHVILQTPKQKLAEIL